MSTLTVGGIVVTIVGRHFDAVELLDTVETERVNTLSIVGDAFAKPILRALDAEPDRWDISSLRVIVSSGVIWSSQTKAGLLRHNERLIMVDWLGTSEAIGMASTTARPTPPRQTATFKLGPNAQVRHRRRPRGRAGNGRARPGGHARPHAGRLLQGPGEVAATFQVIDGVRWTIPGDFAEVDADGTVRLFGRGSQCINTGGEKVYPEEVEEALKLHPTVADAAVVGVPDERFGEAVTAIVEPHAGDVVDEAALIAHVRRASPATRRPSGSSRRPSAAPPTASSTTAPSRSAPLEPT